MKVDLKNLPKSQIEMLIELDSTEWGKFVDRAAKHLAEHVKIDGFRPGAAPKALVEQKVGMGKILEEAADLAVRKTYGDIVKEKDLEIIGYPEIQVLKVAEGNPFEFKVKAAMMPAVKLGDYQAAVKKEKIKDKSEIKVEEKEIDESLGWLQKSRTKFITVNRQAQKGDRVEVDFVAQKEGKTIDGGESKNHPVILGENKFVPGFEDNLIGMKENEEKKFSLVFPEKYHEPSLASQKIDFETKVKLVQEAQKPELNDEFAKSLGKFEDLPALKKSIQDGIAMEKQQREKEVWRAKILEGIVKDSQMDLPDVLVEGELEKMYRELEANVTQMGLTMEKYLENIKKTKEELLKEWREKAAERVKSALVLQEIARQEKIAVSDQEVEEETNKFLAHYPNIEAVRSQIDIPRVLDYTRGRLQNEKVFEFLEKIAANR